jgi:hypothetical protein
LGRKLGLQRAGERPELGRVLVVEQDEPAGAQPMSERVARRAA